MPGIIDDQVHFREPDLTHHGELIIETHVSAASGTTSRMDMPNVKPVSVTQELLEQQYQLADQKIPVNYNFYRGVSNDHQEEVPKKNIQQRRKLSIIGKLQVVC